MQTDYGYFEEDKLGKPYDFRLLRRLYPFIKSYNKLIFFAILIVLFITFLDISNPYLTKIAIDRYIVPKISSNTTDPDQQKKRFLKVDTRQPEVEAIVRKYEQGKEAINQTDSTDFFIREGDYALISYDHLAKLDKNELELLRKDDLNGVMLILYFFILLIIFDFVSNFSQVMILEYIGQKIMHDLRMKLFSHLQSLSVSYFSRNPVGRLVTRATNDIQNMYELFNSVIVFVFKDLFLLIGIAGVLLWINWKLALVSFIVVPFVVMASAYFSDQARDAFRDLRITIAEINTQFAETIAGMRVIQVFLQEQNNYRRFEKVNHENYLAGMKQTQIFALFFPIVELLGSIAIASLIFYGGRGVLFEKISLGELVAFISYIKMFFRPIRDIAEKYNIMQNAMASAERIFIILDSRDQLPEPESESEPPEPIREMEMHDVCFSYIANEVVLKDVSFKVSAGMTIAFVGPTGSGKTSIINLMIRFYDPDSGKVMINGRDIKMMTGSTVRSKMALVTQDPFLFSGTIRNNIFPQPTSISAEEQEQIIEDSNCKTFIDRLPNGLDTELSEGGTSISSGERQLISIARAFARNPDLILLDEATSYIDSETEVKIQEALANLMRDRTSIIVAHRLSTARNADAILVLNRGRIIESGNHEALMASKGFYYRLNQLQG